MQITILRKAFIFIIREIPCNSASLYNKLSAILARSCPFGVQMVTLRIKGGSALNYYNIVARAGLAMLFHSKLTITLQIGTGVVVLETSVSFFTSREWRLELLNKTC